MEEDILKMGGDRGISGEFKFESVDDAGVSGGHAPKTGESTSKSGDTKHQNYTISS